MECTSQEGDAGDGGDNALRRDIFLLDLKDGEGNQIYTEYSEVPTETSVGCSKSGWSVPKKIVIWASFRMLR